MKNIIDNPLVPGYGTKTSCAVEPAKVGASAAWSGAKEMTVKLPIPPHAVLRPVGAPEVLSTG